MLDALKKALKGVSATNVTINVEDAPVVAEAVQEVQEELLELAAMQPLQEQLAELVSQVEQLNSVVAEKDALLASLNSKLEGYADLAAKAEAEAAALQEQAKLKELNERREMLADVIGKDNPGFETTFTAIGELPRESFDVVVSGFKASFAKEAESAMFKEVGVSGDAEVPSDAAKLNVSRFLKKGK
jgi:DNA repair exonuclease SbcCD ATPase subunit